MLRQPNWLNWFSITCRREMANSILTPLVANNWWSDRRVIFQTYPVSIKPLVWLNGSQANVVGSSDLHSNTPDTWLELGPKLQNVSLNLRKYVDPTATV